MLSGAIVVMLISITAGTAIRVWAFAIFAFFVATGLGVVTFTGGSSLIAATLSSMAILALMEVSYLVGVFLSGLWRRTRKFPKSGSTADAAHATDEHRGS
ncbi:hypothetical protein N8E88_18800 [Phyllobacterium zundukense]|jgi:hypothetical protein|uniref:Uncharacterized protein n=2 Tax=Phyllobacterium zundukense TaxID=1867719 RepID=A0ACD4DA65_9HYPH|nr:hypothetical protein [Phyllobacterium zundukense]UXN62659.1 hypothetical protein N8E88_18800 [Phyllobacterium zundukense]